jgi:hypothetical protein
MPDTIDLQSDEFMTLLTDALRAGPGSPEWSAAVKALRASNQNVDEFTLLQQAREDLESGKEYRSVRAGPGFTRKLLSGIDEESQGAAGVPTASIIALLAAGTILVVVAIVGVMLLKGGGNNPQQQAIEQLNTTIFGNKFLTGTFGQGATLPPEGWRTFGDLPLMAKGGELRPAATTAPASEPTSGGYRAGGIVSAASVPANLAIEVDATLKTGKLTEDGILQVFVSDEPITDANAAGSHAMVWQLKGNESRVFLADASAGAVAEKVGNWKNDVGVKMLLNRDTVIVQAAGKQLYAGPHKLSADAPRYVGVRFLGKSGEKWDGLGVTSAAVLKP